MHNSFNSIHLNFTAIQCLKEHSLLRGYPLFNLHFSFLFCYFSSPYCELHRKFAGICTFFIISDINITIVVHKNADFLYFITAFSTCFQFFSLFPFFLSPHCIILSLSLRNSIFLSRFYSRIFSLLFFAPSFSSLRSSQCSLRPSFQFPAPFIFYTFAFLIRILSLAHFKSSRFLRHFCPSLPQTFLLLSFL